MSIERNLHHISDEHPAMAGNIRHQYVDEIWGLLFEAVNELKERK